MAVTVPAHNLVGLPGRHVAVDQGGRYPSGGWLDGRLASARGLTRHGCNWIEVTYTDGRSVLVSPFAAAVIR